MKATPFLYWTGPGASIIHVVVLTSSFLSLLFSLSSSHWSFQFGANARITNRTIDDTLGDAATGFKPVYRPQASGVWERPSCQDCALLPDTTMVYDNTWTAATYHPGLGSMSVELQFTGVAIYIFLILANPQDASITGKTVASFILDGQHVGDFEHDPSTTSTDFQYDSLAFATTRLSNTTHNLTMATTGNESIYANFDYAIYSFDEGALEPSTSRTRHGGSTTTTTPLGRASKAPSGALVGGVVGGVILFIIVLFAALFFLLLRRRRQKEKAANLYPRPLIIQPPPPMAQSPMIYTSYNVSSAHKTEHYESPTTFNLEESHSGLIGSPTAGCSSRDASYPAGVPSMQQYLVPNRRQSASVLSPLPASMMLSARNLPGWTTTPTTEEGHSPLDTSSPFRVHPPSSGHFARPDDHPAPHITLESRSTTATATPEQLRRERQQELDLTTATIQQEMRQLNQEAGWMTSTSLVPSTFRSGSTRSAGNEDGRVRPDEYGYPVGREVEELKQQIRMMNERIEYLQKQYLSPWALGLTDEPPPGYSRNEPQNRV
ncbi:hypothetical protein BDN72DRAFT_903173 [Pluteus cervinus]|uniref:Uncharacterized protein n=1 Tax=Pluteus cervinus TaxID=181527 RepID=A0ACD3AA50_9AGAR|nr:hypothetical protein BDN72DRAFT_903173 [Pluteus cervinus]